jgi:Ketopantoate reductase PanE/ApbA
MVDSTNGMVTTSTSDHNEGSSSRLDVRAGPNVLIVGAGALGRVIGRHLQVSGASVSVLVKQQQRDRATRGFCLHRMRRWRRPTTETFVPVEVFTDPSAIGSAPWDVVWLCVHSPALSESWVQELHSCTGRATIVSISQGLHDRARLERLWPESQIVEVVPALFAFDAPLGTPDRPISGTGYWIPPGAALAVAGREAPARAVIGQLQRGGLSAKYDGVTGRGSLIAALNIPYFAALESAGWSFASLGDGFRVAAGAAREASNAVASARAMAAPPRLRTSPWLARATFRLLRLLTPFDFETYTRNHFTKVGDQTRDMLESWIEAAQSQQLPITRLEQLRARLPRRTTR